MIWLVQQPEGMAVVNSNKPHQGRGFYLCPDIGCLNGAKKKNKEVRFLETMDFRYPTAKVFLTEEGGNDQK
jgi:predicted RNA-binding protein YlxR (DUF448 family)